MNFDLAHYRDVQLVQGLLHGARRHVHRREGEAVRLDAKRYRVTHQVVTNLPLTSKQKFSFGLAWSGLTRPKQNFGFEFNGRFCTS